MAHQTNAGLGIVGFGQGGDAPYIDKNRIYYAFWAVFSQNMNNPAPIMKFVDWHGNLYYRYRHYTQRFSQNTTFEEAVQALDLWIRTGPKPD